jgi:Restriction endonuclease
MINAEPNEKQVGDRGVDGVARFPLGNGKIGKLLVSVKGGKTVNPSMVRDLSGTVEARKAQMGILITLSAATKGVIDAVNHGGVFTHPANGHKYPRLQHITVADLLAKKAHRCPRGQPQLGVVDVRAERGFDGVEVDTVPVSGQLNSICQPRSHVAHKHFGIDGCALAHQP